VEERIGKKNQWMETNEGMGVKWEGLERPFNHRRR